MVKGSIRCKSLLTMLANVSLKEEEHAACGLSRVTLILLNSQVSEQWGTRNNS